MFFLPNHIIIKIYEYDSTFTILFDKVIDQINSYTNYGLWWITRGFISLKNNQFMKFNDQSIEKMSMDQYFHLQMVLGQMLNKKYKYNAIIDYYKLLSRVKKYKSL